MNVDYMEHLKAENAFLRTQIEEHARSEAELRAALRDALRLQAKALPAPGDESLESLPTPPSEPAEAPSPPMRGKHGKRLILKFQGVELWI